MAAGHYPQASMGEMNRTLTVLIQKLEGAKGFDCIVFLSACLQALLEDKKKAPLSTEQMNGVNEKHKQRIETIFQFTIANFQQPITLTQIASLANMSLTAFCAYFKKSTRKSYIEFLNEIRIVFACKLLQDTDKSIIDICYESGFNTAANFNKQFLKVKSLSPRAFRNRFCNGRHITFRCTFRMINIKPQLYNAVYYKKILAVLEC